MKTDNEQDGTIIEFLCGEKPFQGVWFGQENPKYESFGKFWWRPYLREYASQFNTVEPEKETQDGLKDCPYYMNVKCKCEHGCEEIE